MPGADIQFGDEAWASLVPRFADHLGELMCIGRIDEDDAFTLSRSCGMFIAWMQIKGFGFVEPE